MNKIDSFLQNSNCFYVAGYEYNYDNVFIFLNKPLQDIDERGSRYYKVKDPKEDLSSNIGLKIPYEIAKIIGLPFFEGSFSLIKIEENLNSYLSKNSIKFRINNNLKLEML